MNEQKTKKMIDDLIEYRLEMITVPSQMKIDQVILMLEADLRFHHNDEGHHPE